MGCLYVIKSMQNCELYKIGVTSNWDKRAQQLYVNKKTSLHSLVKFEGDSEKLAEKELHRHFKRLRLPQSEWFFFDDENYKKFEAYFEHYVIKVHKAIYVSCPSKDKQSVYLEGCENEADTLRRSFSEEELRAGEADDWVGEGEETFYMAKEHNPFLLDFEVCDGDRDSPFWPHIYIKYVQPNNLIGYVSFGFEFCEENHNLKIVYLSSATENKPTDLDWFAQRFPEFDEKDLFTEGNDHFYLVNLYSLLGQLMQIPEPQWPFYVRKEVFEAENRMRRFAAQGLL